MNVADMTDDEIRDLDPTTMTSRTECLQAMDRVDLIKASIEAQINGAIGKYQDDGERASSKWMNSARSALHFCRAKRGALQSRMTVLKQMEKEANIREAQQHQLDQNALFIRVAKAMLPEETYMAIWATVNKA